MAAPITVPSAHSLRGTDEPAITPIAKSLAALRPTSLHIPERSGKVHQPVARALYPEAQLKGTLTDADIHPTCRAVVLPPSKSADGVPPMLKAASSLIEFPSMAREKSIVKIIVSLQLGTSLAQFALALSAFGTGNIPTGETILYAVTAVITFIGAKQRVCICHCV